MIRDIFNHIWTYYKRYADLNQDDHEGWINAIKDADQIVKDPSLSAKKRELAKGLMIAVLTYISDISSNKTIQGI